MTSLSRTTCHAVHSMPSHAREGLARDLYAVHAQIFTGQEFEEFREYVVERPAWRTWIYVRHDPAGKLVGYTAIHAFLRDLQGRKSTIIRMEAGTLAEARGRDATMVYGLLRLMRVWLSRPLRPVYMFAALTHPSSYTFLARYVPGLWPHAERHPLPPKVLAQMEELAEAFHLERVYEDNPLIRHVNWITIESDEERRRWQASTRPDTRFYMAQNPGYVEGHGMVTLLPLSMWTLTRALGRFVTMRAGRLWRLTFGGEVRPAAGTASGTRPQAPQRRPARIPPSEPQTVPHNL